MQKGFPKVMKKIFALLLFALLAVPAVYAAEKPLGVEEFTSVEELALSISSYFPKAQGVVKSVQGDRLTISLGKKDGMMPGMELMLWRDGKEILHPVTNAVIGRAEEQVGTIEILSVGDDTSTAVMKKKVLDPREGDKARITPRKINMAIVPLRPDSPDIVQTLVQRLNEFGRINVLEPAKVDAFVRNSKAKDAALIRELGSAFGLDAVVSLGIFPSEGKQMVTARIFYTDDASQLDTIVAMLDLKSRKEGMAEIKPFFTPEREKKKEERVVTQELPFVAKFFTAGDFEGNGKLEYAFSDGTRIHIYRNDPSGWREVWTETDPNTRVGRTMVWSENVTVTKMPTLSHINVDAADINGNGRPEIFVTVMSDGKVKSYVLEYQDGTFHRIAEVPGFLRIVSFQGKPVLIGQAYDPNQFYSGSPKQYSWTAGAYTAGEDFPLPKGLGIYGWSYANLGEGKPMLVALDEENRLQVYSGGGVVWKSADQYATVDNYVYKPATGVEYALQKQSPRDKGDRVKIPGRVAAIDVNGDGRDEIVVVKNITSTFLGGFSGAELDGFAWTGARLDPAWGIKDIPGPVYDFSYEKNAAGLQISALVRTKGGLLSKDVQQMLLYTLR
jgi:hypothetical protein